MTRKRLVWLMTPNHPRDATRLMARTQGGYYYVRPTHERGLYVAWLHNEDGDPIRVSGIKDSLAAVVAWCENDHKNPAAATP